MNSKTLQKYDEWFILHITKNKENQTNILLNNLFLKWSAKIQNIFTWVYITCEQKMFIKDPSDRLISIKI